MSIDENEDDGDEEDSEGADAVHGERVFVISAVSPPVACRSSGREGPKEWGTYAQASVAVYYGEEGTLGVSVCPWIFVAQPPIYLK